MMDTLRRFFGIFFGRQAPSTSSPPGFRIDLDLDLDFDDPNTIRPFPALYNLEWNDKVSAAVVARQVEDCHLSASDYTILDTLEVKVHGNQWYLSDTDAINVYVVGWELCVDRALRNKGKVWVGREVKNPQELRSL